MDEGVEAVEEEVVSSEVVVATARLVVGFKATVVGVVAFAVGRPVVGAEGLSKEGMVQLTCIYGGHD